MGNHRFKLSDMMPNAWFYKLKDMSRSSSRKSPKNKNNHNNNIVSTSSFLPQNPTYSYNLNTNTQHNKPPFPNLFPRDRQFDSPRRSSTFRRRYRSRRTVYRPSPRLVVSSSDTDGSSESEFYRPFPKNEDRRESESSESDGQAPFSSCSRVPRRNIVIGMKKELDHEALFTTTTATPTATTRTSNIDDTTKPRLPPIITKPATKQSCASGSPSKPHGGIKPHRSVHNLKGSGAEKAKNSPATLTLRVSAANSSTYTTTGVRIRANSPRIASRKNLHSRKSLSSSTSSSLSAASVKFRNKNLAESFAVVKSSVDPESDFKASMAEMIKENRISASKDLEDLLACYLSLNSHAHHNHIVKAFEQIWFDITHSPCT